MKAPIDIEDLLVWAYREELPKVPAPVARPRGYGNGWASMSAFAEGLALINWGDVRNAYGVTPDRMGDDLPHHDALLVHEAVSGLDGLLIEVPADWWPFADMAAPDQWGEAGRAAVEDALERLCIRGEDGVRRFKVAPSWLVRKHAMVGSAPEWEAEAPEYRYVRGNNGGHARWFVRRQVAQTHNGEIIGYVECEVDGFDLRRRRPYPGAYHKMELVPSPFYSACDRAEYEVWWAALSMLATELGESLGRWIVSGPRRSARPWEDGKAALTRVLPSLRASEPMGT